MNNMKLRITQACIAFAAVILSPLTLAATDGAETVSDGPGPIEMQEIMNAHVTGGQLYRKKKYAEAVEHLEIAAKGGMKRSQAQLGAIFLGMTGSDEVDRDTKRGVGWLGVAAHGNTEPQFKKSWEEVYGAITPAQHPMIDKIVDGYIEKYGPDATHVTCKQTRRAGTRMSRLVCTFDDLHKYRDELNAETYSALTADGQISDYAENYRSSGFGGTGGGGGPGGGRWRRRRRRWRRWRRRLLKSHKNLPKADNVVLR